MYAIGEHVLRAVYLTRRPKKDGETANPESYAGVRPSAKIVDDGPPDIFVRTAFAEGTQGCNCDDEENDMDNESKAFH